MNNTLLALAPYVAGIISAVVMVLNYREAKRKTKHEELEDLANRLSEDNARLRKENEELRRNK